MLGERYTSSSLYQRLLRPAVSTAVILSMAHSKERTESLRQGTLRKVKAQITIGSTARRDLPETETATSQLDRLQTEIRLSHPRRTDGPHAKASKNTIFSYFAC